MPIFHFSVEQFMGYSHSGSVMAYGTGTVELTDEQLQRLVALIREHGGETHVETLGLKDKYPDIYDVLDEACHDAAWRTAYNHWVIAGYENGWCDDPDDVIEKCEEEYGFKFEFDENAFREENGYDPDEEIDEDEIEDARNDAFYEWVEAHRAELGDEDKEVQFLSDVFDIEPEMDGVDYEVEIPEEIVELAKA